LQIQTRKVVQVFAIIAGAVSLLAVLLYGFARGGWLEAILGGIALGMSMLPEEFPVVLTVFMTMGAWRISRARVLARRATAIETLGSATVLCTDKTGTLTENQMSIAELSLENEQTFRRREWPLGSRLRYRSQFRRILISERQFNRSGLYFLIHIAPFLLPQ
jgi:Ca2+-transporting ATPase